MNNFKVLSDEDLVAVASPFRRELLAALEEPASAVSLARRFDMSRQRIGYHMRELEKAGCIEKTEERQKRGLTEHLYRVKPLAYVFAPERTVPPDDRQDRFSWATLINSIAQSLWDLVSLRRSADDQGKRLATLALVADIHFANPSARREFTEELIKTVETLARKYDRPEHKGARSHHLLIGAYPTPEHRKTSSLVNRPETSKENS